MKKYVKPELCYESFELSEQIAVGCSKELIANYQDKGTCTVNNPLDIQTTFFAEANTSCKVHEFEGYCYFNGSDGYSIFTS